MKKLLLATALILSTGIKCDTSSYELKKYQQEYSALKRELQKIHAQCVREKCQTFTFPLLQGDLNDFFASPMLAYYGLEKFARRYGMMNYNGPHLLENIAFMATLLIATRSAKNAFVDYYANVDEFYKVTKIYRRLADLDILMKESTNEATIKIVPSNNTREEL